MGPRSADRGNRGRSGLGDTATIASMGPRSADRGNMVEVRSIDRLNNLLQWGRDQLIAEIGIAFNCAVKQARASMGPRSADRGNGRLCCISDGGAGASMGPRSADRGNMLEGTIVKRIIYELQWGRDQLIAEMWELSTCFFSSQKLQWGRDQLIAEIRGWRPRLRSDNSLQWGRDQLIAEICC